MAAEMYDSGGKDTKPTHGTGNAQGKPIRPVLLGVGAVIALILVALAFSRTPGKVNPGTSESGAIPVTQYSPASSADTAIGQRTPAGSSDTASRPAPGPVQPGQADATSMSGSSSLPAPGMSLPASPMASPLPGTNSAGQNFVAPPGPAANRQEMNR